MSTPVSFAEARAWAERTCAEMTLTEKCEYVSGTEIFRTKAVPRLGIPHVWMADATAGLVLRDRFFDTTYQNPLPRSVAFPAPILLAASWSEDLAERYARAIAEECRANGVGVLLGPGFNLYRVAQCGRNFEYFGEDPHLIGALVRRYVEGVQSLGVIATLKHFAANNTDYFRRKANSVVSERTLREIYLPAFKAGIDAGALAVMTAYNPVNGEWAGQSRELITDILRGELGFTGLVMTDWWSVYDLKKLVHSGQDLEMPTPDVTGKLAAAVGAGEVEESAVDRMVISILTAFKQMNLFERQAEPERVNDLDQHLEVALETARQGTVLLKNNGILPLSARLETPLLLGDFSVQKAFGAGAAFVRGFDQIPLLDAVQRHRPKARYLASPTDADIRAAEVVLMSVGTRDGEGYDRPFALPEDEARYLERVLRLNSNVVLLVHAGSGVDLSPYAHRAAAVVYCFYNGQNGHLALAEILVGKTNPSGKLPFTLERNFQDGPGAHYVPQGEALYVGMNDALERAHPVYDVNYQEEVFVGYRWYEAKNIAPLYPFGFGLSYTQFHYSGLQFSAQTLSAGEALTVTFTLSNTGDRAGYDIAQVYVSDREASLPRPAKELKGFAKVWLEPGEARQVSVTLAPEAFSFYKPGVGWQVEAGIFDIKVGPSSAETPLVKSVEIQG